MAAVCAGWPCRLLIPGAIAVMAALTIALAWRAPSTAADPGLAITPQPRPDDVVTLEADAWPPFNDEAGATRPGYAVELARRIFADAGLRTAYRVVPWRRALERARSGACDGALCASRAEAGPLILPEQEVAIDAIGLLVRADDPWRFDGIASFTGRRLATIDGYDYTPAINAYLTAHAADPTRVQTLADDTASEQNLRKLLAGRVDVVIDSAAVLDWRVRRLGAVAQVRSAGHVPDSLLPLYLAFTPDARGRRLAALWDQGLARLRDNGELQRILAGYQLTDWRTHAR